MKKILKYLPFLPAVFGVLALIMIFLPAITIEIEALEKTYYLESPYCLSVACQAVLWISQSSLDLALFP